MPCFLRTLTAFFIIESNLKSAGCRIATASTAQTVVQPGSCETTGKGPAPEHIAHD